MKRKLRIIQKKWLVLGSIFLSGCSLLVVFPVFSADIPTPFGSLLYVLKRGSNASSYTGDTITGGKVGVGVSSITEGVHLEVAQNMYIGQNLLNVKTGNTSSVGIGKDPQSSGGTVQVVGGLIAEGLCLNKSCISSWNDIQSSQWQTHGTHVYYATGGERGYVGIGSQNPKQSLSLQKTSGDNAAVSINASTNNTKQWKISHDRTSEALQFIHTETPWLTLSKDGLLSITALRVTGGSSNLMSVMTESDESGTGVWKAPQGGNPSGQSDQTLRYDGQRWVANDVLKIFTNETIGIGGSGGTKRVNVSGDVRINHASTNLIIKRPFTYVYKLIEEHPTLGPLPNGGMSSCSCDKRRDQKECPDTFSATSQDNPDMCHDVLNTSYSYAAWNTYKKIPVLYQTSGVIGIGTGDPKYDIDVYNGNVRVKKLITSSRDETTIADDVADAVALDETSSCMEICNNRYNRSCLGGMNVFGNIKSCTEKPGIGGHCLCVSQ